MFSWNIDFIFNTKRNPQSLKERSPTFKLMRFPRIFITLSPYWVIIRCWLQNLTYIPSFQINHVIDCIYDDFKIHTCSITKVYHGELLFNSYFNITSGHMSITRTKYEDDYSLHTFLTSPTWKMLFVREFTWTYKNLAAFIAFIR